MVDENHINRSFKQNHNSCVLSSYGGAAYYYTKIPINEFFLDYCRHYFTDFSDNGYEKNPEAYYEMHFHGQIFGKKEKTGWRAVEHTNGFRFIESLHNTSRQKTFVECRKKFNLKFYDSTPDNIDEIEEFLKSKEALLCVSNGGHSRIVGYNSNFYLYDYGVEKDGSELQKFNSLKFICERENIKDSLLLYR